MPATSGCATRLPARAPPLQLPLGPRVPAEQVHELSERHAAQAGIARVDIVDQLGQRLELHAQELEVGHGVTRRPDIDAEQLGVPAAGRFHGARVRLDRVEPVQDPARHL
jgi:hypothetical protein